ncbi:hypothetical protein KEM56_007656 [Ascosphaera pollenicola]|nr:hypothetical protein KEM56_007656 [Ascosphaera pollenicola]
MPEAHVNLDVSIYLTCDEALGSSSESQAETSPIPKEKHVSGVSTLNDVSDSNLKLDEVEKPPSEQKSPNNAILPEEISQSQSGSCGNGGCKCKRTVDDEDANEIRPCCCSQNSQSVSDNGSQVAAIPVISDGAASASEEEQEPPRYTQETYPKYSGTEILANPLPQLRILTGRPDPRNIIRSSLERARGESGVVVCGPPGLMDDVQRSVTALSDERAVHKGTGAQGIYFHSEGFWY